MNGIVARPGPGQAIADDWLNQYGLEARARGTNAADAAEQILTAGAKRIMIEGVHAGVLKTFLRGPTVPAFPDGGGALLHGKQPGGKGVLQEQAVGGVSLAPLRQDRDQVTNSNKPGRKVSAFGFNVVFQELGGIRAEV